MKNTPLRRTVGLKRGTKGLKKSKLRAVGLNRKPWDDQYKARKAADGDYVRSAFSGIVLHRKTQADPHHPFGKVRERILAYLWVEKDWHKHLHDFNNQSLALGWIQPQFRGAHNDGTHPRPWREEFEGDWPDSLRRI